MTFDKDNTGTEIMLYLGKLTPFTVTPGVVEGVTLVVGPAMLLMTAGFADRLIDALVDALDAAREHEKEREHALAS
jgi:hypothetical protein